MLHDGPRIDNLSAQALDLLANELAVGVLAEKLVELVEYLLCLVVVHDSSSGD